MKLLKWLVEMGRKVIISFWFFCLIAIVTPILVNIFCKFEFTRWQKIIAFYSLFGFMPTMIIFIIFNQTMNPKTFERKIINIVGVLFAVSWAGYLLYSLLSGEFV